MGEILAYTLALAQRDKGWCADFSTVAFIDHGAVYALHEVMRGFRQGAAGREAGAGELHKGIVTRHIGRGEEKFGRAVVSSTRAVAELVAHLLPQGRLFAKVGRLDGAGGDDAVCDDAEAVVAGLQ